MQDFTHVFEGVEDPRTSNATLHDRHAMLMIGLLTIISGGEGCSDMAIFGREKEDFLRRFLRLEHGIPSHDSFSRLFRNLDTAGLQYVLLRQVMYWSKRLGDDDEEKDCNA